MSQTTKVPMGQKIAFGLGMLANQMFPAALQIFMVVLVQDYGLSTFCGGFYFFFLVFLILSQTQSWVLSPTTPNLAGVVVALT